MRGARAAATIRTRRGGRARASAAAAALRGAIASDPDDTIPVDQLATYSWDVAEAMLTEYDARMRKKEERFVAAMRAPDRVPMPRRLGRPTPDKAGVSAQGAE
jgi:hypothetical protein